MIEKLEPLHESINIQSNEDLFNPILEQQFKINEIIDVINGPTEPTGKVIQIQKYGHIITALNDKGEIWHRECHYDPDKPITGQTGIYKWEKIEHPGEVIDGG